MLFFGGPLIVKQFVGFLFQDRVELKSVTVTPKLQIEIRKIEFDFSDTTQIPNLTGFLRGAKINWSIEKFSPTVEFSVGSASLKKFGNFDKASLKFEFPSIFQLGSAKTFAQFTELKVHDGLEVDKLSFTGNIDFMVAYLTNLSFHAESVEASNFSFSSVDSVTGKVDVLTVQENFLAQKPNMSITLKNIQFDEGQWILGNTDISITPVDEELAFVVQIPKLLEIRKGYTFENIYLRGKYDNSYSHTFSPTEIEIEKIYNDKWDLLITRLTSEISHKNDEFNINLNSDSVVIEAKINDRFYGKLKGAEVEARLTANEANGPADVNFWLAIETRNSVDVFASFDSNFELSKTSDLFKCLSFDCIPERVQASLNLSVNGESLAGSLECFNVSCSPDDSSMVIATTDTAKFFAKLSEAKILNPIFLAGFYNYMMAGRKNDSGHIVEY